ncbi:MAG: lasso peptide biosynthesis B2 protein [Acidobacteria bacterium]|nr:lasso peptide biosynthesis B2 protein [Acidobacteriota bacterium]
MTKLSRWNSMSGEERRLWLTAWLALPMLTLLLRCFGLRRTQRLLVRLAPDWNTRLPIHRRGAKNAEEAQRLFEKPLRNLCGTLRLCGEERFAEIVVRLINSASRHGLIAANCLPQSLLVWWMLRREGIEAELRIGVRKERQTVEAHAWVELSGRVLNDRADVEQRFQPFDAVILPPEVRLP